MATEFVILGSGTGVPTADRGAASYLHIHHSKATMLDCGPGASRRLPQAGIELRDIERLLITHFHTDHICDLSAILFGSHIKGYTRNRPLEIIGPLGLKEHYRKVVELFGKWVVPTEFELLLTEVGVTKAETTIVERDGLKIVSQPVAHNFPSVAYRLETDGGVVVYSGDTDYCKAIVELCKDADLALLECSTADEDKIAGHLSPEWAGRIAKEACVKHLVLSHFYPESFAKDLVSECRRYYEGQITIAEDLMRIRIN